MPRSHRRLRSITLIALVAVAGVTGAMIAAAFAIGSPPVPLDTDAAIAPAAVTPAVGSRRTGVTMRVSDIEFAGPAVGATIGIPNRVGSISVPARQYDPVGEAWGTLVWAHGGSFMRGTLDWPEADWVSRRFAEAGLRVYSVDYALASATVKAPAPGNDVAAVLSAAIAGAGSQPVFIGGASAGAHLATLAALAQADSATTGAGRAADALILEYPTLHRVQRPDAAIAAQTAQLPEQRRFGAARITEMYDFYLGKSVASDAPVSPGEPDGPGEPGSPAVAGELPAARLALLPPTVIVNADADDLRASGEQFAEQLRAAGVPVVESVQAGTVHGYLNRPDESSRSRADAQESIDRFVAELRRISSAPHQ